MALGKWSNRKRKSEAWFLWNWDAIRVFCYTGALSVAGNRKLSSGDHKQGLRTRTPGCLALSEGSAARDQSLLSWDSASHLGSSLHVAPSSLLLSILTHSHRVPQLL